MPQETGLTPDKVRNLLDRCQYTDGNGLNLRVESSGAKHWIQRVTINSLRRNIDLSSFPAVPPADDRELAVENHRGIKLGRDPLEERRQAEEEQHRPACPTFAKAAEEVICSRAPTWTNPKHPAK